MQGVRTNMGAYRYISRVIVACALGLLFVASTTAQSNVKQRVLRIDDFEHMEVAPQFRSFRFSPDGEMLAFERVRPRQSSSGDLAFYFARHDIWLQDGPGRGLARNLTNGLSDGSGWFAPQWSPDGRRLAFLSTRGGNVNLWAWERATKRVVHVSKQGVETLSVEHPFYRWVDNEHVMCLVPLHGEAAPPAGLTSSIVAQATAAWAKAAEGESTASVVDSEVFSEPQARLVTINVVDGATQNIGTTLVPRFIRVQPTWWLSPDSKTVAVVRPIASRYGTAARMRMGFPRSIELRSLDGRDVPLNRQLPTNVLTTTLRWSPDGRELAFFAYGEAPISPVVLFGPQAAEVMPEHVQSPQLPMTNPVRLYRVTIESGRVDQIPTGDIELGELGAPPFEWTAAGELAFHASRRIYKTWGINNLPRLGGGTSVLLGPPTTLEWWVLSPNGRTRTVDEAEKDALVGGEEVARRQFERTARKPDPDAGLAALTPAGPSAVYIKVDRNGAFAWRMTGGKTLDLLASANTFTKDIVRGPESLIDYLSLNREPLKAILTLPVDRIIGRRYPLIVKVYPGRIFTTVSDDRQFAREPEDVAVPAGFAVLQPSMPRNIPGMHEQEGFSILSLTNGVLPAVEKAIAIGAADPDRVFVTGVSHGGWATYGLVTQTNRFKAAMTIAGFVENRDERKGLHLRYSDSPHALVMPSPHQFLGTYGAPSDVPWWRDAERYRRNSPLTYVDRVQTPLLILHGDMDVTTPMDGAQDFFQALTAMRKRAQFVRYWGAGHGIDSPANFRDRWRRTLAWFDEFGDILRDGSGNMIFEGDRVKPRNGATPLKPEDFSKFDLFQPSDAPRRMPRIEARSHPPTRYWIHGESQTLR
jgi:dipeptidyl aminopeptidase/acylaminoacyl peptidase